MLISHLNGNIKSHCITYCIKAHKRIKRFNFFSPNTECVQLRHSIYKKGCVFFSSKVSPKWPKLHTVRTQIRLLPWQQSNRTQTVCFHDRFYNSSCEKLTTLPGQKEKKKKYTTQKNNNKKNSTSYHIKHVPMFLSPQVCT